jgi:hypothetical protein
MQCLLPFHGNNDYTNTPEYYVCTYIARLVFVAERTQVAFCGNTVSQSPQYYMMLVQSVIWGSYSSVKSFGMSRCVD